MCFTYGMKFKHLNMSDDLSKTYTLRNMCAEKGSLHTQYGPWHAAYMPGRIEQGPGCPEWGAHDICRSIDILCILHLSISLPQWTSQWR